MNDDTDGFALQASSPSQSVVEPSNAGEGPLVHNTDEDHSSPSPTQMTSHLTDHLLALATPPSVALPSLDTMSVHSEVVMDTPAPSNPPASPDGRKRKGGAQRGERTGKRSRSDSLSFKGSLMPDLSLFAENLLESA
jgi:hypothetical protein